MASVAGLAPARVGLKGRLRELLCIHGRKWSPRRLEKRSGCSRAGLNSVNSDPSVATPRTASRRRNRARLVSEERSERRDDGHESGINEVLDHCLDVFVGGGSLFVEQIALFADDPAAQRRLGQLVRAEAFAHAQAGFAPRPLAAGTVSQRPGVAFAIAEWLDEVAERTARTRDDHRLAFGRHGTFAVNPDNFTVDSRDA